MASASPSFRVTVGFSVSLDFLPSSSESLLDDDDDDDDEETDLRWLLDFLETEMIRNKINATMTHDNGNSWIIIRKINMKIILSLERIRDMLRPQLTSHCQNRLAKRE